ncbi:hypothetical protein HII13_005136 [Brettanomyces bruxellensis]|nr:hypothetical protein HII13_005136 [Brettanomyces bruxellensis]
MQYLTYLAQTGHLEDPRFLNYLKYLEYWRQPEYAKQLVYPDCLHILTLLQSEEFRKQISKFEVSSVIYNDMVARWKAPLEKEGDRVQLDGVPNGESKEKTTDKKDEKDQEELDKEVGVDEGAKIKEDADAMDIDKQ